MFMSNIVIYVVYVEYCLIWTRSKSSIDNVMRYFKKDITIHNWEYSNEDSVSELLDIYIKILGYSRVKFYQNVFRVCLGARYLGGTIGDDKSKRDWLRERTLMWEENISMISKTTGKYPQESYAAVVRTIQS